MRFVLGVQGNVKRIFNSGRRCREVGVSTRKPVAWCAVGEGETRHAVVLGWRSAPELAFLLRLAAGIVIVPHRPISRLLPQAATPRDDLCRLWRVLQRSIHWPIPSRCSLSGILTVCTAVIRPSFMTSWLVRRPLV